MALVHLDEIAESQAEFDFIRHIERIESQALFQSHDDQRETERVEPRIEQLQIVGQPSQLALLFRSDLLELRRNL